MQPPLNHGTLLQNRFRIVKILGQGGCGRTYLVTDEQRFQEYCVIKEYFPIQGHVSAVQKSWELFQREAEILYQIQHPQIPQFRALFEEAGRFFFAQDFVAGKPYHLLWQERLSQGKAFTEGEVLELLDRLLPILDYLHRQNIIHRDISLDNIMLRDRDRLPVLIDFGVGKLAIEASATQASVPYGTVVGKAGYSPIEQLKTGKVYPNSDLYALAVSAIVLLTGKAPQDLFDEMTVNWVWRTHAPTTSHKLAQILDRMLSYRPQQRYQSADEVLAELALLNPHMQLVPAMASQPIAERTSGASILAATVPRSSIARQSSYPPAIGKENQLSPKSRPIDQRLASGNATHSPQKLWGRGIEIGTIVVLLSIVLIAISNTFKPATPKQYPLTEQTSSSPKLLTLGNTPIEVSGQVDPDRVRRYAIEGIANRELSIRVITGAVSVQILHPDGQLPPGSGSTAITTAGNYFFPYAGKFLLDVKSTAATNFTISVGLGTRQSPQALPPAPNSLPLDRR
jgi:serine/threonine protein kinase